MNKPNIILANDYHQNQAVINLKFEKDQSHLRRGKFLISRVKSIAGARWSQSRKFWYVPAQEFSLSKVFETLQPVAYVDYSAIKDIVKNTDGRSDEKNNTGQNSQHTKNGKFIEIHCNEKESTFYLSLPYELKEQFKKLEGAWWHGKKKQWSALDTEENRLQLTALLNKSELQPDFKITETGTHLKVKTPKLQNPVMPDDKFIRHLHLENKAESTKKQYSWYVKWFLTVNRNKQPDDNPGEMVKSFLHDEVLKRGYGKTSQNRALTALQNYYRIVYNIDLHAEAIPRAKQKRPLPKVLAEEQFLKIYKQYDNKKHQIILKLMYGCGLRRDEVCNLKTEDVNIERELIFVKGKGSKYRPVNPGTKLIKDIKEYLEFANPGEYFIEGQTKGKYSGTSIAKIVERLAEKAGIKRKVTPHMFRYTFATHHMERGTELRLIQEALGHASSKTTEIYTRVSRNNIKKMRNLLDDMEI